MPSDSDDLEVLEALMLRRARYDVRMLDLAWGPADGVFAHAATEDFRELADSLGLEISENATSADLRRLRMWIARCASRPTPLAATSGVTSSTVTGASTMLDTQAAFGREEISRVEPDSVHRLRWSALAVEVGGSIAVERADGNSSQEYISLPLTPTVEQFRAAARSPISRDEMHAALMTSGVGAASAKRGIDELPDKHFLTPVQSALITHPTDEPRTEPDLRHSGLDLGRDLVDRAQRIANLPFRQSYIQRAYRKYVERFVERFGPDELVPISKVVSPGGIGRVGTLLEQTQIAGDRAQATVMEHLFAISAPLEAHLDDSWLDALANARVDDGTSSDAIPIDLLLEPYENAGGDPFWFLSSTALRDGLTITPRWLHRSPPDTCAAIAASAHWWRTATTMTSDVDYVPRTPQHAPLVRRPPLAESTVAISSAPAPGEFDVASLLIGQAGNKLILVDPETQTQILPLMASPYNPMLCPAAVELLATMRLQYGRSPDSPFPTPPQRPVTPRLVLGDDVIAPAQWKVEGKRTPSDLAKWFDERNAPALLTARSGDKHVTVRWRTPAGIDYLASQTRRDRPLALSENLTSTFAPLARDENGQRYASEIAFAAVPTKPFAPVTTHRPCKDSFTLNEAAGEPWATLKIYADEAYHDTLLSTRLQRWVTASAHLDAFYIRCRDPLPHIRLRVRTKAWDQPAPYAELHQFAHDLRTQTHYVSNCMVADYSPELRRFDSLDSSSDPLFDLFVADSALCVAIAATGCKNEKARFLLATAVQMAGFAQFAPDSFSMFQGEISGEARRLARAALAPYAAAWDGREDLLTRIFPPLADEALRMRVAVDRFRQDRDVSPETWLSLAHLTMNRLGATEEQETTAFGLSTMVLASSRSRKHHLGQTREPAPTHAR